MKQWVYLSAALVLMTSCSVQRQRTSLTGRTDDVYFTPSDTRKTEPLEDNRNAGGDEREAYNGNAGNYSNTYSNRLRHFGTRSRFNYGNYSPILVPTIGFNPYSGWTMGLSLVDPRFGYMSGFNSPFSMYYGYYMPYYDPFYSYGWGSSWMYGYQPYYMYNPYFYNPCHHHYGYNYGHGYYNPYYHNNYNYSRPNNNRGTQNYGRRTGTSNNVPAQNTYTPRPQNSSTNTGTNTGKSRWYSGGNEDRGGTSGGSTGGSSRSSSGGSGSSGGNSDRGGSGSSGGSNRRR